MTSVFPTAKCSHSCLCEASKVVALLTLRNIRAQAASVAEEISMTEIDVQIILQGKDQLRSFLEHRVAFGDQPRMLAGVELYSESSPLKPD